MNLSVSRFCHSSRPKNENKSEKRQIVGSCQRAEKTVKHKSDGDTNGNWCLETVPKGWKIIWYSFFI